MLAYFVLPQVMLLVNRLNTNIFFVTHECALKIALTRRIFQSQMHQISFSGRALPGPAGGAYSRTALPQTPSYIKGCLRLREGRNKWGGKVVTCVIGFRWMDAIGRTGRVG